MSKLKDFPATYGRFHQQLKALSKLVDNDAPATEIGRAAARLYLDRLSLILNYSDTFNATFGLEMLMSNGGAEENLPQMNSTIRMFDELTGMLLRTIDGFIKCFGGQPVIAAQALEQWAAGNPHREMYLADYLAAMGRARRSRR